MNLHSAAMAGKPEAVGAALATGADACALDDFENSALHLLAAYGHGRGDRWEFVAEQDTLAVAAEPGTATAIQLAETAAVLLAAGATAVLDSENAYERTPLADACVHGNLAVAGALIDAGASTAAVDTDGWPLLHAAAKHGHPEVCRLFLEHGADASAQYCGMTALHSAASSVWRVRGCAAARVLIEAGAAPAARDEEGEGQTAAELAAANGWSEAERGCFV